MGFIKEFKEFEIKGNVVDLAVGVVIGAEFGKIINSVVSDIIMPPIGKLIGGKGFVDAFYALDGKIYESLAKAKEAGAPIIAYGNFFQTIINFLIIAFAIFLVVKFINVVKTKFEKEKAEEKAASPSNEELLLTEIRDLLKNKQ